MIVVPVTITIRLQIDENRTSPSDAEDRIERAIRRAYKENNSQFRNETISYDHNPATDFDKSEAPGTFLEATLKTERLFARNVSRMESEITRQIEQEFDHDIVGAKIRVEDDDGNSSQLSW